MKTFVYGIFFCLLLVTVTSANSQTVVSIGSGSSTQNIPVGMDYGFKRSVSLYLKNEINLTGDIRYIGWIFSGVTNSATANCRIYLKMTSATVLTSSPYSSYTDGATLIYNGTPAGFPQSGVSFELNNYFSYDNNFNLLVIVETNFGSSGGETSTAKLTKYTLASNLHQQWQSNTIAPTDNGSVNSNRPNLNLLIYSPALMQVTSTTAFQKNTNPIAQGSANQEIIGVKVITTGAASPLQLTNLKFSTTGTTTAADISKARVFYTGNDSVFNTSLQVGTDIISPSGIFNVSGTQSLFRGTNYFWLAYDIQPTATIFGLIDGQCPEITVSGINYTSTVTSPPGSAYIQAPLSGAQIIGLGAFNTITGRTVEKKVSYKNVQGLVATKNNNEYITKEIVGYKDETISYQLKDTVIEEITYYENGHEISQDLKAVIPKDKYSELGIASQITDALVYATIESAISDLNKLGVSGPVTFTFNDDSFDITRIAIDIKGVKPTISNTITFKPSNTFSSVTINGTEDFINSPMFLISDNYITFDGSNNNTTSQNLILKCKNKISPIMHIGSKGEVSSTNVTIKNCIIWNGSPINSAVILSNATAIGNAGKFNTITLQNNQIRNAYIGVYANGGENSGSSYNLTIKNNKIAYFTDITNQLDIKLGGVYVQGVQNCLIEKNEISDINSSDNQTDRGIWIGKNSTDVTIDGNLINKIGFAFNFMNGPNGQGIFIATNTSNSNVIVKNNVLYQLYGGGFDYQGSQYAENPCGIVATGNQSGLKIYNNSIYLSGNTLYGLRAVSAGIILGDGSTASIMNNAIANNLGKASGSSQTGMISTLLYLKNGLNQIPVCNYNVYSWGATGGSAFSTVTVNTTIYSTMTQWKTFSAKDNYSYESWPGFTSETNLQPANNNVSVWVLEGTGYPTSDVPLDYSGNSRPTNISQGASDIGAYQFQAGFYYPPAVTGTISYNGTTTYKVAGVTIASIRWGETGVLPTSIDLRRYSGRNPPEAPLNSKYMNCYWYIVPSGGFAYTYDITLYYSDNMFYNITNENNLGISKQPDAGGNWTHYNGTTDTNANTVTVTGLTSMSRFAIDQNDFPLPVELSSFVSSINRRSVQLRWVTVSEINNQSFDIERLTIDQTNNTWIKIGNVSGNGTTNEMKSYSYDDNNLETGRYLYRLKQIDYNGNYAYFNLETEVEIGIPNKFSLSQNYPNPFNPSTKIDYDLPVDSEVRLKIYDMTGREVITLVNEKKSAGYYTVLINSSNLTSGTYIYQLITNNFIQTKKMVLIK